VHTRPSNPVESSEAENSVTVLCFYKMYQVNFWGIVATYVSVRKNETRNEQNQRNQQLLPHSHHATLK